MGASGMPDGTGASAESRPDLIPGQVWNGTSATRPRDDLFALVPLLDQKSGPSSGATTEMVAAQSTPAEASTAAINLDPAVQPAAADAAGWGSTTSLAAAAPFLPPPAAATMPAGAGLSSGSIGEQAPTPPDGAGQEIDPNSGIALTEPVQAAVAGPDTGGTIGLMSSDATAVTAAANGGGQEIDPNSGIVIIAPVQAAIAGPATDGAIGPLSFDSPAATAAQIQQMLQGVQGSLLALETALSGTALKVRLPLIGDKLGQVASVLQSYQDLETAITNTLTSFQSSGATASGLQTALNAAIAPLGYGPNATTVTLTNGTLTIAFAAGNSISTPGIGVDAKFGLPGLDLSALGAIVSTVSTTAGYTLGLTASVNSSNTYVTSGGTLQLATDVEVPSLQAEAQLGLLRFAASVTPADPDYVKGAFTITTAGSVTFSGSANVDVHLATDLGAGAAVPGISADLAVKWPFNGATVNPNNISNFGDLPTVALNNVAIDFGSYVSSFLAPILTDLDALLTPIQPVVDLFTTDLGFFKQIPGFDWTVLDTAGALNLAGNSTGDGKVTLLDFMNEPTSGTSDTPAVVKVIEVLSEIHRLAQYFSTAQFGTAFYPIGSFNIPDIRAGGFNPAATTPQQTGGNAAPNDTSVSSFLGGLTGGFLGVDPSGESTVQDLKDLLGGSGFNFPLLTNPLSVAKLLLGNGATDLLTYQSPPLTLGFGSLDAGGVPQGVPIVTVPIFPGVSLSIDGYLLSVLNLDFGLDTKGLQEFAAGGFTLPNEILDGVYTEAPLGPDGKPTLFSLDGGVAITAHLGVPGTEVTGSGDVKGAINVLLSNPGKNYLSDLLPILNGPSPLDAFTAFGSLFADLELTVKTAGQQVFHLASDPLILARFGRPTQTDPTAADYVPAAIWKFGFGDGEVASNWDQTFSAEQMPTPYNGSNTEWLYGDTTITAHPSGIQGFPDITSTVEFRGPNLARMTSLTMDDTSTLLLESGLLSIDGTSKASILAGTIDVTAGTIPATPESSQTTLQLNGVVRNSGTIVVGTPTAFGPASVDPTIAATGIVDLTGGGKVVSGGDASWIGSLFDVDQLANIDNTIAGAGDFAVPILNEGIFDANSAGVMTFDGVVLNSGLMRATGPALNTLGALRGRMEFKGVNLDTFGGTIFADGGTVYFDNGTTVQGGKLLGRQPDPVHPIAVTPFEASGTVTLDGGTSGLDIEALILVEPETGGGLGANAASVLIVTGLINSQPFATNAGASAIVSGNETVRLENATILGGELDASAPATGAPGSIEVIGSAMLDGQAATQGVGIAGTLDVHSATLGIVGGIVPVAAGSGINLSDASATLGVILTAGDLLVGGGASNKATLAPVANGGPGQGLLSLAPDGKSTVSGRNTASELVNSWLITGAGLLGDGILAITNTGAGTIEANGPSALIVNTGSALSRNQGLIHTASGGLMVLEGSFNNAGGRIVADGGLITIGGLLGSASIQGGTLATANNGTIDLFAGVTLDGVAVPITLAAGASIVPGFSQTLTGSIVNLTTLTLAGASAIPSVSTIAIQGTATLSGGGAIVLTDRSGQGSSLTQIVTGTSGLDLLDNVDNTISGTGLLGTTAMSLTNEAAGLIEAVGGLLRVGPGGPNGHIVNAGTMRALGGTLDLTGSIANAGGTIDARNDGAAHSGTVLIDGLTIAGGLLAGDLADPASLATTTTKNGTLDGTASPLTIANSGQLQVVHNSKLTLLGSIVDQGTIGVMGLPGSVIVGDANVVISGTVNLTGGGSVLLSRGPTDVLHGDAIVAGKSVADRLNNGVTISGNGFLGATALTIDNLAAGTVIADGGTLVVNTDFRSGQAFVAGSAPVTNAGLLTSVTTGLLDLISDVANTGGTIGASGGGITVLDNNIVSGGTFDGSGGGRVLSSSSTIDATVSPVTLTSGARVGVQASAPDPFVASDTLTLKGSFLNHGTLFVSHDANDDNVGINIFGSVTLGGGGQLQILDTLFSGAFSSAFVQGDNHGTITNYSSNTLDNIDNLISGNGRLGNPSLRIINEAAGIISSISGSTLAVTTLSSNSLVTKGGVVNQGVMRAFGGTLDLQADIDNRGGTIAALSNGAGHSGHVIIDGGSLSGVIKGGTFTSDPGDPNSFIQAHGGTIDGSSGAVTLTAGAPLHIVPDSTLEATGTIVNLGTVVIFSNTLSGVSPALVPAGTLVMTGGGRVAMSFAGGAPDYIRGTSDADLLDNVDNTIIGFGRIGEEQMSLLNEAAGTIAAQGGTLIARIDSTVNHGLLEALGGTLQLIGTIANAGGTIAACNDGAGHSGTVLLAGVTIQGGVLTTDVADPASVITPLSSSANLLDGSTTAVTLAAGGQLQLGPSQKVTLTGAISNRGTIALAAQSVNFNSTAQLIVAGTATISGGGLISLTDTSGLGGTHEQSVTGTAKTDTLDNVDNTISGVGRLGSGLMTLINEAAGTIIASGGSLIVDTGTIAVVNHGAMSAAVGGTLDIRSPVSNSGGTIGGGGGIALIDNAGRVSGGTLIGQVYGWYGTIDGVANAVTVAAGATLAVVSTVPDPFSKLLYLKGTIANQGTMLLRDDDAGLTVQTEFVVSGTVALTGGGLVSLTGKSAQDTGTGNIITGSVLADTLDNIDNTIAGFGRIGAGVMTLINEAAGKVSATGGTLTVYTGAAAIANQGLLTSGTKGVLDLLSPVTNTGGTISADGGVTKLDNITVHGGTLGGSQGGTILVPNNSTLDGTANGIVLTPGALLVVAANSTLTLSGAVANHGTISNSGSIANSAAFVLDGTLINNGTLSGGLTLTGAGGLINNVGKTVPGDVVATAAGETVSNLGKIAGAVSLAGGDRLVTGVGAVFSGGINGGAGGNALEIATGPYALKNFDAAGTPQYSTLQIDAGVSLTLDASDLLTGVTLINNGVLDLGAFEAMAPVQNSGSITGDVTLTSGVSLTNSAGGTISGNGLAVIEALGPASVTNAGLIDPATYGVDLTAGGTVTNVAGGTIEGTVAGVMITGGAGTVTNGGTISGGGVDAVTLAAGFANRVILDPGAAVTGLVDGGNAIGAGVVSTLELAATGGTLSGFGTEYIDFAQLVVDQGASWAFTGANAVAAGTTLTDQGSLLLSAASVIGGGAVTVDSVGGLQAVMTVAGGGTWSGSSAFVIGQAGAGSLAVNTAGTVSTAGAEVAANTGSSGEIAVTGANSSLIDTGSFVVGDNGLGGLLVQANGTVTALAGLVIANGASAAGSSVDVTGTGSNLQITGALTVGGAGFGQLSISQTATVTAGSADAAASAGGGGAISITGTGSALNIAGLLTVGDQSSGSLNIANGASVSVGGLAIGTGASGSGNVVIGPGSHLTVTGTSINVGLAGSAVLDIQGGTLGLASGTTLSPGTFGRIVQVGGLIDPATVFDASGGSFGGGGTAEASGTIVNSSLASVTGGAETLLAPLITSSDPANVAGVWSIKSGGTLVLDVNTFDNSQTIQFGDLTGVLSIGQQVTLDPSQSPGTIAASALSGFAAPIVGYKAGDKITFSGLSVASDQVSGNVVTLFDSGHATLGSLTFQTGKGGADTAGAAAAAAQIACFAEGTRIETTSGPRAVETLREGDRLVLADGGREPIVWIGQREVNCARHPAPEPVWPVRVAAGAFGGNAPVRDLYLSPDHAVFVNDVLVPVKLLINGTSIVQVKRDRVRYFHVELPEHAVILAEGLTVESYLDVGDRANFDGGKAIRLFPDLAVRLASDTVLVWETHAAARLVMTGNELDAARRVLTANPSHRDFQAPLRSTGSSSRETGWPMANSSRNSNARSNGAFIKNDTFVTRKQ